MRAAVFLGAFAAGLLVAAAVFAFQGAWLFVAVCVVGAAAVAWVALRRARRHVGPLPTAGYVERSRSFY